MQNAEVEVVDRLFPQGFSDSAGNFALAGVAACPSSIQVSASARIGGLELRGTSSQASAVEGGTTDVGDIFLEAMEAIPYPLPRFSTLGAPQALLLADLDGDGRLDAATANQVSDNVSVLLGEGDGSFKEADLFPGGSAPFGRIGRIQGQSRLPTAPRMTSRS